MPILPFWGAIQARAEPDSTRLPQHGRLGGEWLLRLYSVPSGPEATSISSMWVPSSFGVEAASTGDFHTVLDGGVPDGLGPRSALVQHVRSLTYHCVRIDGPAHTAAEGVAHGGQIHAQVRECETRTAMEVGERFRDSLDSTYPQCAGPMPAVEQ